MLPQVIDGGGTPTPRNESAASPVMLAPIESVASTITGAIELGSTCFIMIR